MKTVFFFLFLSVPSLLHAGKKIREVDVLHALDSICADTWCEGDFAYTFRSVKCSRIKHTCTVILEMLNYDSERLYKTECTIPDARTYEDLLNEFDLKESVFWKLTDCFEDRFTSSDL